MSTTPHVRQMAKAQEEEETMETMEQYEARRDEELRQRLAFRAEAGIGPLPPVIFVAWTEPGPTAREPAWDGVTPLVWDFSAGYIAPTIGDVEATVAAAQVDLGSGPEAITARSIADAIVGAIEQRRSSVALGWSPERSTLRVLIRTGEQAEAHIRREGAIARGFMQR